MTAQLTLAQRGFRLPATPPHVGNRRFDQLGTWNQPALRLVILGFLKPGVSWALRDLSAYAKPGSDIINEAACAHGFPAMRSAWGAATPAGKQYIADWLGVDAATIWPQIFNEDCVRARNRLRYDHPAELFRATTPRKLTPDQIKARLWERGTSLAQLAAAHGVDRRELGRALAPDTTDVCRSIIAAALGATLHELWPSTYGPDGHRLRIAPVIEGARAK